MELRHLKYFVTVAEELNFRRAAERLYMEQPPLSRQIRQLEEELGVELFHRTRQGVILTVAGQAFLEEARLTLDQADQAVQTAKQFSYKKQSSLAIGFSICAFHRVLPEIVQAFRQRHPEAEVNLLEMQTPAQVQALLTNEIDVGFLHLPIQEERIETATVLREPIVVVLPKSHPLTALPSIPLRSLANEPFVLFPQNVKSEFHQQLMNLCQQVGFQPKVVQEATPPEVAISFVEAGAGISLVIASYQNKHTSGVVYRPLESPIPMLEIALAWRKNDVAPMGLSFTSLAKEFIQIE